MPSEKEIEAARAVLERRIYDEGGCEAEQVPAMVREMLEAAARVRAEDAEDNTREPAVSVETPERIWIESEGGCPYFYHEEELPDVGSPITEYVRADKLEELLKKQEELIAEVERVRDGNRYAHLERIAIKRAEKAEAQLAELAAENEQLKEAMERSIVAIDDWLHQYASDMCLEDHVKATGRRIFENGGTLAYIADVQEKNRVAIRKLKSGGDSGK